MTPEALAAAFPGALVADDLPQPSHNVAPTQDLIIYVADQRVPGQTRVERARWSLTPPWSETLQTPYPTFNARSETAATKPTWQAPLHSRRCVIVTNGFYEWSGESGDRKPHFISSPDGELFMAGLYGWWRDPAIAGPEAWHLTAAVLTEEAVAPIEGLHDRMPVFIARENFSRWIDPALPGAGPLLDDIRLASQRIAQTLTISEVAPLRGDGPHLIDPV